MISFFGGIGSFSHESLKVADQTLSSSEDCRRFCPPRSLKGDREKTVLIWLAVFPLTHLPLITGSNYFHAIRAVSAKVLIAENTGQQ